MSATFVLSGDEKEIKGGVITVYHRPPKCIVTEITTAEISIPDNEQRAVPFTDHPLRRDRREIRLLVLLPALTLQDEVHCEFRVVSLGPSSDSIPTPQNSRYEALSYIWGDSTTNRAITLCGTRFQVTDNLHAALVRLRRTDASRILWVDGLCIDQDRNAERNWQVALMSQIFRAADTVLVWLGDYEAQYEPTADRETERELWHRQSSRALGRALYEPLWSESAWSIQAAAVATVPPTFQFGSCSWSWELLVDEYAQWPWPKLPRDAIGKLRRLREQVSELQRVRNQLGHDEAEGRATNTSGLVQLLPSLAGREAADPRDMVYCLLGLIKKEESDLIVPSYDEPPAQCYSKATFALVSSEKHIACIGLAQHGDIPSWAIDFTLSGCEVDNAQLDLARVTLSKMRRREIWHDYLFDPPPPPSLNEDGSRLRLSGFVLDRVANTSRVPSVTSQRCETCLGLEEYRSSLQGLFSSMPPVHPRQALMQGDRPVRIEPGLASPDWSDLASVFEYQLLDTERLGFHLAGAWYTATGLETPLLTSLWWKSILDYTKIISEPEPVWFRTSYGFVGYSPRLLEPDDVLCLVTSNTHPMVLRKVDSGYTFVCFAWVPGLMNHEIDGILYEIGATEIELV
ncbi:hypothetical protein Daus18300_005208 [Diaporthe australafricana]|uniref:Heterokaryon incompatibility domain-containing protein n=1 Tax=Diaporthe australafricana TaxID=127596 RepID=A0ABR3X2J3_9PEZI